MSYDKDNIFAKIIRGEIGNNCKILFDSGIRTGEDIVKLIR